MRKIVVFVALLPSTSLWALPAGSMIAGKGQSGVAIISRGQPLPLVVESSNPKGVHIAAGHLQQDLLQLAGAHPQLLGSLPQKEACILIGTLGNSPLIDVLAKEDKIDATQLQGKDEKYLVQCVAKPFKGVVEAVVIAGSDMRGDGGEPMSEESNVVLLQCIVNDQRQIIKEVTGKPAQEVPQVWALYKEVQEYYYKGMQVPDDIMHLLCDDNWEGVRKLPLLDAPKRKGGYGMYCHFDYVGGLRNYKWLNVSQVWEQMNLTWEYGVRDLCPLNVGDVKPMEYLILDMAWNPLRLNPDNLLAHTEAWCAQQFGEAYAKPVARMIDMYTKYNRRRTPELLAPDTYNLLHYRKAERVIQDHTQLAMEAEVLYQHLPQASRNAFHQWVLCPIQACASLNGMYVDVDNNRPYASQARASTSEWGNKARKYDLWDSLLIQQFHTELTGEKWNHMMLQPHVDYTYWQQPKVQIMPRLASITLPRLAGLGVVPEGDTLPRFDSDARQSYYMDVYNKGQEPFEVAVSTSYAWILPSFTKGLKGKEEWLALAIGWGALPQGVHQGQVIITDADSAVIVPLRAKVISNVQPKRTTTTLPTAVVWESKDAPDLESDVYVETTGDARLTLFLSPTLNYNENRGLRYTVSVDGGEDQVVKFNKQLAKHEHEVWVANSIIPSSATHDIATSGIHTICYRVLDPGVVLQKIVLDMGGAKFAYLGVPESTIINN